MPKTRIGEVELYYELHGDGDSAIAFVNGIAMTVSSWQPMLSAFSSRYRCLLHDCRGQLRSDKPSGEYSLTMHALDLERLLDHVGLERVHLVGTSYGSEIAMIFAYTFPDRVRSLTTIAGVSELDGVLRAAGESWAIAAEHGPRSFYRAMLPWIYCSEYLDAHQALFQQSERALELLGREYFDAFGRLVRAFLELNITAELHRITAPTLVISAEKDLTKPPRFGRIIQEQIPRSELVVIPGAGHAVVVEKPDEVSRIVLDFLDRQGEALR